MVLRRGIEPEELLAHTGWLKTLARRLVDDDATADDLVQQAYVAALERPPSDRQALTAWLSRVVRNLAARTHRDSMRRRRRETKVAQAEGQHQAPHELIERAEMQRSMMDAVLELEEPFRTTVLLRFFEDRSPQEVAKQTGVSINTVGTRLYRALGKLRQRLDREQGGRATWVAILAPWVGLSALSATTPAAAAITSSSEVKVVSALGSSTANSGIPVLATGSNALLGGIFLMQKPIVASIVVGALCSMIGYGVGQSTDHSASQETSSKTILESEYRDLVSARKEAEEHVASLEVSTEKLQEERKDLTLQLEELREAKDAAEAESEEPEEGLISTGALAFGHYGGLAEIRNANWAELAEAVQNINDLMQSLLDEIEQGQTPGAATSRRIAEENNKLVRLGVSVLEKIPTHSPQYVSGEFTHPICLINLLAAVLESAGVPLTDLQRSELAAIGDRYDRDFAAVTSGYDEETWALTKILEELTLKRDTMLDVHERLTPAQRAVVAVPRIQDRLHLDTLSPVNMVSLHVRVVRIAEGETLASRVVPRIAQDTGIDRGLIEQNSDLLARFAQSVDEILEPQDAELIEFVHLDDIIIAGRAQEQFLLELLDRSVLTDDQVYGLVSLTVLNVPQAVISNENSATDESDGG